MRKYDTAIEIYEFRNFIHSMNKCYEAMTRDEKDSTTLFNIKLRHAKFCEKYGRLSDALKIYQEMEEEFFN